MDTNKFLKGVLSQPSLNENYSSGFASRNKDKFLYNNIVQSTTCPKTTHIIKSESTSKVDRIIEDFLHKVKKRSLDPKINSVMIKDSALDTQQYSLHNQKRTRPEYEPLRFFRTTSPWPREETMSNPVNTRDHYKYKEERNNNSNEDAFNNSFTIPALSHFMKTPHRSNYHYNSFVDLDETADNNYLDGYEVQPLKLNHSRYNKFTCNESKIMFEPFVSARDQAEKKFQFDCDFISPIPNSFLEEKKIQKSINCIQPPKAFSTPNFRECSQLSNLVKQTHSLSQKSVGTQTDCNHICLMCSSSPIKKQCKRYDYFYEE